MRHHHPQKRNIFAERTDRAIVQLRRHEKEIARLESAPGALQFARQANDNRKPAGIGDLTLTAKTPFIDLEEFVPDERFALRPQKGRFAIV